MLEGGVDGVAGAYVSLGAMSARACSGVLTLNPGECSRFVARARSDWCIQTRANEFENTPITGPFPPTAANRLLF